jgi:hypothetical protein
LPLMLEIRWLVNALTVWFSFLPGEVLCLKSFMKIC